MKSKLFLIVAFCFISLSAWSQWSDGWYYDNEYMRFGNVRETWKTEQGTITDIDIEAELRGCFAQISLSMTFDASQKYTFSPKDSLEVQMRFNLPDNSIITDLYLWVENEKVQAGIYESTEATQVYETIVSRRQDPAFLRKYYGNYYDLKIFPLMTDMPRKVQITYLTPVNIQRNGDYSIPLPLNILQLADKVISDVNIEFVSPTDYTTPEILENSEITVSKNTGGNDTNVFNMSVQNPEDYNSLNLTTKKLITKPLKIHVYKSEKTGENFYCSEFQPAQIVNIEKPTNTIFIFDIADYQNAVNKEDIFSELQNMMLANFKEYDNFNILYSDNGKVHYSNENMLPCTESNIKSGINSVFLQIDYSVSYLEKLLKNGISYADKNNAEIILISSSFGYEDYNSANKLIATIKSEIQKTSVKINCIYISDIYNYRDDYYSTGNSYLLRNIARYSGGEYYDLQQKSYPEIIGECLKTFAPVFPIMDMHYSLKIGFTFNNFEISDNPGVYPLDMPVNTVGRFKGEYPFYLDFAIEIDDSKSYTNVVYEIPENEISPADSVLKTIWTAMYIENLMKQEQTNSVVKEIIDLSIKERILTNYTAFLALEPGMNYDDILEEAQTGDDNTLSPGIDEEGEGGDFALETINNLKITSSKFTCSPNPAVNFTYVELTLQSAANITISVYNIQGQKIKTILSELKEVGDYSVKFDVSELAKGIYILELKSDNGYTKKLKLIKN